MAQEPFLETKVDTDAFHFIQELFRLGDAFRRRSLLHIDQVWVRVKGVRFPADQFMDTEPDIGELTRADLETLTLPDQSTWTLYFNTYQHEVHWKVHFEVELQVIGGSHPLLVRYVSSSDDLDPFLANVLERCAAYWDPQIVSLQTHHHLWSRFFQEIDVRPHPWLSALERLCYGKDFERYAPSVSRTKRERSLGGLADDELRDRYDAGRVPNLRVKAVGSSIAAEKASQPNTPETFRPVPPAQAAPLEEAAGQDSSTPSVSAEASPGDIGQKERSPSKRIYGPTEEKIAEVRKLLAEKRNGQHRGKPWSWVCGKCGIDLKTAQKHLAAEREEWDKINARQLGRTAPSKKPKQPDGKRGE